jgi:hypothetical protein
MLRVLSATKPSARTMRDRRQAVPKAAASARVATRITPLPTRKISLPKMKSSICGAVPDCSDSGCASVQPADGQVLLEAADAVDHVVHAAAGVA